MKRDEVNSSLLVETLEALEQDIAASRMARKALLRHGEVVEFLDRSGMVESIAAEAVPTIYCKEHSHLTVPEIQATRQFLANHASQIKGLPGHTFFFKKPFLRVVIKEPHHV